MQSLVLATRNPHKLREFSRLLEPAGIAVEPLPEEVELPPEVGDTFTANARPKAHTAAVTHILEEIAPIIGDLGDLGAIGHRVVHGGDVYTRSVRIDKQVKKTLAELVDLNPKYLGEIERGEKIISIEALLRIAKAVKTPICEFFRGV